MSLFTFVHHLDRHTQRRRRSRDSLSVDSGRGDLRSAPLGRLHEAVLSISLDCAAAPRCGCLWALPGCPARPHSRRLWSERCDLRSGLRSSIPAGQARCCRRVVPHNGSRCRTSSPVLGAMCRSGLQTTDDNLQQLFPSLFLHNSSLSIIN